MTVPVIISLVTLAGLIALAAVSRIWSEKTVAIVNGAVSVVGVLGVTVTALVDYGCPIPVLEDFAFYRKVSYLSAGLIFVLMLIHALRVLAEGENNKYGRMLLLVVPTLGAALVLMLATVSSAYFFDGAMKTAVLLVGVFEAMALRMPEAVSHIGAFRKKKTEDDEGDYE